MKKVIYIILQVVFLIVLLFWVMPATSYFQQPIDTRDGTFIYFLFLLINTTIIILLLLRVLMLIDKPKIKVEQNNQLSNRM